MTIPRGSYPRRKKKSMQLRGNATECAVMTCGSKVLGVTKQVSRGRKTGLAAAFADRAGV